MIRVTVRVTVRITVRVRVRVRVKDRVYRIRVRGSMPRCRIQG